MSLLTTTKKISLDFHNSNMVTVQAKQFDNESRYINITCTDFGKKVMLNKETMSAFIRYRKADNKAIFHDVDIIDDGTLLVTLTNQMLAVPGRQNADIIIVSVTGLDTGSLSELTDIYELETSLLSTMTFYINVIATPIDNSKLVSEEDVDLLTEAISDLTAAQKSVAHAITNCEIATNNADNATIEANAARDAANQAATATNELKAMIEEFLGDVDDETLDTLYGIKNLATIAANAANEAADKATNVSEACNRLLGTEEDTAEDPTMYGAIAATKDATNACNAFINENKDLLENSVQKTGDTMTGDLTVPNLNAETSIKLGQSWITYDTSQNAIVFSFETNNIE